MKKIIFLFGFIVIGAAISHASPKDMIMSHTGSPEFERLKTLAGHWIGQAKELNGTTNPATVDYKVTSGGSAVVETLGAGTPHEMTSVYFEEKGKLKMTHYCMLGNRPALALKSASTEKLEFDFDKSSFINPEKEMHMHALNLLTPKPGELIQEWNCFQDGKSNGVTVFTLKKIGSSQPA